jgi:hypothetical protein
MIQDQGRNPELNKNRLPEFSEHLLVFFSVSDTDIRDGLLPTSTGWGSPNRDGRNGFSVENGRAGICGSYSPQPTLVLDRKPVEKHGSEVTYRSVVTTALAVIPFRSLLVS